MEYSFRISKYKTNYLEKVRQLSVLMGDQLKTCFEGSNFSSEEFPYEKQTNHITKFSMG